MQPLRWDLSRPEQLGSLTRGRLPEPYDVSWAEPLVGVAARVVARSGDSDLVPIGRSFDNVADLLDGLLAGTSWERRVRRLPLSVKRSGSDARDARPGLRAHLTELGLDPRSLASRRVALVDYVYEGETFAFLVDALHEWCAEEGVPWRAVGHRLRFVGLVARGRTSPTTWRWQQHRDWEALVPARLIRNVSVDPDLLFYLSDRQPKTTHPFTPDLWGAPPPGPRRDDDALHALAVAAELRALGREVTARRAFVRALHAEPAIREPWLRALAVEVGRRRRCCRARARG